MPNYDLKDNGDSTFTLTLYSLDEAASPVVYATMTANPYDTVYNLLYNVLGFDAPETEPPAGTVRSFSRNGAF